MKRTRPHRLFSTPTSIAALMWCAAVPTSVCSQVIELDRPESRHPESFSLIRGVQELSDERVVLTDWTDERVVVLDFSTGESTSPRRVGAGPSEFRLRSALYRFRADSTLLQDLGNTRLAVLDRERRSPL